MPKKIDKQKANQMDIVKAIKGWTKQNKYSPSFRDLVELTGLSLGTIHAECRSLREQNKIEYLDGVARTLRAK